MRRVKLLYYLLDNFTKVRESIVNTRLLKLVYFTPTHSKRLASNKLALTIDFPDLSRTIRLQAQNLGRRASLAQTRTNVVEIDTHFFASISTDKASGSFFHGLNGIDGVANGNTQRVVGFFQPIEYALIKDRWVTC